MPGPDGVLLVAKPPGVTSHDVVAAIRREDVARGAGGGASGAEGGKAPRVGHAGTLDPFATGLLVVLVAKAYRVVARLGAVSDTGDPTGEVTPTGARAREQDLRAAAARLTGEIDQRVPAYSAVKVAGERLYSKARRGEPVERPMRRVRIERFDVLRFDERAQEAEFEVHCSSGTYVRQLVADLGELCEAGAYCRALERTQVGPFELAQANDHRLIPLAGALSFLPERELDSGEAEGVRHGRRLVDPGGPGGEGDAVRLTAGGLLVAVAERRGADLKPVTVLG